MKKLLCIVFLTILFVSTTYSQSISNNFEVTVDYSRTLIEMMVAGKYDRITNSITEERYPLPIELIGKKITVSTRLFHFNRAICNKDAITEMNKLGFRPATIAETFALGESQPDLQSKFPIIALGSVWYNSSGHGYVLILHADTGMRELRLERSDDDWSRNCRFLAVSK